MKIKHGFNLIEITLSIAIIAFGMSSILVLFPVGMQTTTETVADSVVPDTADYVMSYLQAMIDVGWHNEDGSMRTENAVLKALDDKKPDTGETNPGSLELEAVQDIDSNSSKTLNLFKAKGMKGVYLYEQSYYPTNSEDFEDEEKVVDFSAVVMVWKEPASYIYHEAAKQQCEDNGAVTLCVEISYPAAKPYDAREKQFYRLELYNQVWKTE